MKKKISTFLKKNRKKVVSYLATNKLFIIFILFTMIETVLIRANTIKNVFDYKPLICDLALIIIIGSLAFLIKPSKRYKYYRNWLMIITIACIINSIYYIFYTSFVSFSLLATISQIETVGDSLVEKFRFVDFIYIIFPILFHYIHNFLLSFLADLIDEFLFANLKIFHNHLLLNVLFQ